MEEDLEAQKTNHTIDHQIDEILDQMTDHHQEGEMIEEHLIAQQEIQKEKESLIEEMTEDSHLY